MGSANAKLNEFSWLYKVINLTRKKIFDNVVLFLLMVLLMKMQQTVVN